MIKRCNKCCYKGQKTSRKSHRSHPEIVARLFFQVDWFRVHCQLCPSTKFIGTAGSVAWLCCEQFLSDLIQTENQWMSFWQFFVLNYPLPNCNSIYKANVTTWMGTSMPWLLFFHSYECGWVKKENRKISIFDQLLIVLPGERVLQPSRIHLVRRKRCSDCTAKQPWRFA